METVINIKPQLPSWTILLATATIYIHAITVSPHLSQALSSCCLPSSPQRFAKRAPYAAPVRPTGCQFGSWTVGRNQLTWSGIESVKNRQANPKLVSRPLFNTFLGTVAYSTFRNLRLLDHFKALQGQNPGSLACRKKPCASEWCCQRQLFGDVQQSPPVWGKMVSVQIEVPTKGEHPGN